MTAPTLRFGATPGGASEVPVDLERLITSRMLLQANSGGGKSRALRSLLEGTHGRVQQLVLDPEGEFATLREIFPYVIAGRDGDVPATPKTAALLCRRVMELGASAIIDLYDLSAGDRREFVHRFLTELMHLPRTLWRPTLVVIDEAHQFAPERGSGEAVSTEAVITLCSQGRKRGYAPILATQRISKLHKDAAAELLNKLIGRTGLDVDLRRAGDELGFDKDARMALRTLEPGEFFAYGPAIGATVQRVRTGPVQTVHPSAAGAAAVLAPPPASLQAVLAQLGDLPREADEEAVTVAQLRAENQRLTQAMARSQRATTAVSRDEHLLVVHGLEQRQRSAAATLRVQGTALEQSCAAAAAALRSVDERLRVLRDQLAASLEPVDAPRVAEMRAAPADRAAPTTTAVPIVVQATRRLPGDPSVPQVRMLGVLVALERLDITPAPRATVAVLSDQSPRSSGFDKNCSTLRTMGAIEYSGGGLQITDAGRTIAVRQQVVPDFHHVSQLLEAWQAKVSTPQAAMLNRLAAAYPVPMSREELALATGQSVTSSGFDKNCSTLRTLGLLEYLPQRQLLATPLLMPPRLVGAAR